MRELGISWVNKIYHTIDKTTVYFVVGFTVFAVFMGYILVQNVQRGTRAEKALCVFRDDIERRAEAAEDFLIENPNGIPGITPETIRQSLKNQEDTLKALDSQLDCDNVKD
jgi:hypothetical protein